MKPIRIAGDTQVVAVTAADANVVFASNIKGEQMLLIQSDQVATGERAAFRLGNSAVSVAAATDGVVIHAGTEGIIVKRKSNDTHIGHFGSGALNLLVTPIQTLS